MSRENTEKDKKKCDLRTYQVPGIYFHQTFVSLFSKAPKKTKGLTAVRQFCGILYYSSPMGIPSKLQVTTGL